MMATKKKLRTDWTVFCEHASFSDGKVNLSGVFDEIRVLAIPTNFPRFFVVSKIFGKPKSSHSFVLKVNSPSGESVFSSKGPNMILGDNGKLTFIVEVVNMPISEFGIHRIDILGDDKILDSKGLPIVKFVPGGKVIHE